MKSIFACIAGAFAFWAIFEMICFAVEIAGKHPPPVSVAAGATLSGLSAHPIVIETAALPAPVTKHPVALGKQTVLAAAMAYYDPPVDFVVGDSPVFNDAALGCPPNETIAFFQIDNSSGRIVCLVTGPEQYLPKK